MSLSRRQHNELTDRLGEFQEWALKLKGDEKGEAQLFCDRFFRAFGHGGIIEAHGTLEARIKFSSTGRTKFADCLWSPDGKDGVLIEMKTLSERNLESHFPQVRDYWVEMNPEHVLGPRAQKPAYIILCNFKRFVIYKHLTKVDDVDISELVDRSSAFYFLLPEKREPIFRHNVEAISRETANTLGELYKHLVYKQKESKERAQRFVLQSVLALFSEDFGLLPSSFFAELIRDCQKGGNAYDLIGGLYRQMASPEPARGGRFSKVQYFNGGLFDTVEPLDLDAYALDLLAGAANQNWTSVNPAIFGSLFEGTLSKEERHALGAHFTSEADILKIVNPTIIRPWRKRIEECRTLNDLRDAYRDLENFVVLDPACGCGNFLFVAYQSLKEIEFQFIRKIAENYSGRAVETILHGGSRVVTQHFRGIDIQPIAVEVAKMTMMIGKEIAAVRWNEFISELTQALNLDLDTGLPLDRLDDSIVQGDALFDEWPSFNALIGNPPFQSKNKMQQEMDPVYIAKVRDTYPDVPGRADYCVYWFRRAHDEMNEGQRAGLVGTKTISQNYSRMGGLDYIVETGGVITEAVASQAWPGEANVNVSIVNWIKGDATGKRVLSVQLGDSTDDPFEFYEVDKIPSSLSAGADVTLAKALRANSDSEFCAQGQTHGHEGFLLPASEGKSLLEASSHLKNALFPFLTWNDLLAYTNDLPRRFVIDFRKMDGIEAKAFEPLYSVVEERVKPERKLKADEEASRNSRTLETNPNARVNRHHANFYRNWWKLSYGRDELMDKLESLPRYIVCGRVTKRPIFEFVSNTIHPNDALVVFPLHDDYSFGILQSEFHWDWFCARCSTLLGRYRYTSNTVFDSFPWPQKPKTKHVRDVCSASVRLRRIRRELMQEHGWTLRDLYRASEESEDNPLNNAQEDLNHAVRSAYGASQKVDTLRFLMNLNTTVWEKEQGGELVQGPGLPSSVSTESIYFSDDCIG